MLSFFSAVSQYITSSKRDRVDTALDALLKVAESDEVDPLGMINFNKVRSGLNPRKTNVGFATRKLINVGFKEFFREDGSIPLPKCWAMSAD
jgi:hypothetical protein